MRCIHMYHAIFFRKHARARFRPFLGHPNHSVERTKKLILPCRDLNRGLKAQLNVALDRAATVAGQNPDF